MSVNLKMDGNTYEGATKITVGGKVIDIEEIGGTVGGSMELTGSYNSGNGLVTNGASHFYNSTTYGKTTAPSEFVPSYTSGIIILDLVGTNQGSASANGLQKCIWIYSENKAMSFQSGYRSGNSRQSACSDVGTFADSILDVHTGNTYTTYVPNTCTRADIYEAQIPKAIADAILAVVS